MSVTSTEETIVTIVGIRFRPAGRIYYFDPQGASYSTGQYVIVETSRGVEAGRVVIASKKLAERELSDPLKPVLRLALEDELRMMLSFKGKEKEALVQCARQVQQHNLPMKLVEAEYTFDGSRLTFYFTADERVDFRALVRDLALPFARVLNYVKLERATRQSFKAELVCVARRYAVVRGLAILALSLLRWRRSRIYLSTLPRFRAYAVAFCAVSHMKTTTMSRPNRICPR